MNKNWLTTAFGLSFPLAIGIIAYSVLLPNNQSKQYTSTGKQLAEVYCKMCHLVPEPKLLDKKTWSESVLPNMGMRLGIRQEDSNPFKNLDAIDAAITKKLNIYPETPLIGENDWDKIVSYYLTEAPETLPAQKLIPIEEQIILPFSEHYINIGESLLPKVSLLKFDIKTSELYVCNDTTLYKLNNKGQFKGTWKLNSAVTQIELKEKDSPLVSTIGSFTPSDQKLGSLVSLESNGINKSINLNKLQRPVYFTTGDLNMDGKEDVLICNFGNYKGSLAWYDNFDAEKEHILSALPGARKVEIKDINKDGLPDVVALMAQAYEKIIYFINEGNGNFREKEVLYFSPLNGTSYFELIDFNNDGIDDLLISNGDNWDLSPINKPYHGVRIYLNDGNDNFSESYFFPMYGCSKAMAKDFDNDGDLDIVATSFYSDLEDSRKSFAFLKNEGNLNFKHSYLKEPVSGKWLTMEIGDFNNDKKPDIVLGSFIFNVNEMSKIIMSSGKTTFPHIMLLSNLN